MKRKILSLVFALLMVASMLLGCSKSPTKITLNEVTHSVFYAPQYVAMEMGFFEEAGLTIDLVNGGGSDKSMTALLSGDADIALMGPETAVYVHNEGKQDTVAIIGQLTKRDGTMLVAKEKDDNFTWEKLKGKTIIGGRKGGMPNMTLEYVLKQQGLEPGVDVIVDTSVSFNLMAGAFEGSNAEYVTLFEPTASMCVEQGKGYIVASIGDYGEAPYTAYMIKKSTLKNNQEKYQQFMNAIKKGQDWVMAHTSEEIAKVIAPQFPESDIALLTTVVDNYKTTDVWKDIPVMLEEDFNHMQDIIEAAGELAARADFSAIVDNSIAEKAK